MKFTWEQVNAAMQWAGNGGLNRIRVLNRLVQMNQMPPPDYCQELTHTWADGFCRKDGKPTPPAREKPGHDAGGGK